MKLHIGCFNQPQDGWHNTDITPHIFISKIPMAAKLLHRFGKMTDQRLHEHEQGVFRKVNYLNVSKRFPFETNSATAVFSSHIIEHLFRLEARHMLEESLRILQPGGVCRVVAPSLEWALSLYDEQHPEEMLNAVFEVEQVGAKNRHKWMYTAPSLIRLMQETGFSDVKEYQHRQGRMPDVTLIDNRPENSIYVEGIKA